MTTLAVGVAGLAGCLGGDAGGGFGGEESEQSDDGEGSGRSAAQESFVDRLDEELAVRSTTVESDALVVTVQTTGTAEEDRHLAAEVYVNFAAQLDRDLRVKVEDRELRKATFSIRKQWAEQFASGEIDAPEYLDRIDDTWTT
jgi:hypothetical protein